MLKLILSALDCEVLFPELAVGGTTGHRTEQEWVDLDDFTDCLRCIETTLGSSGINRDDHTTLELERQRRCAFLEVHQRFLRTLRVFETVDDFTWIVERVFEGLSLRREGEHLTQGDVGDIATKSRFGVWERFGESKVRREERGLHWYASGQVSQCVDLI